MNQFDVLGVFLEHLYGSLVSQYLMQVTSLSHVNDVSDKKVHFAFSHVTLWCFSSTK